MSITAESWSKTLQLVNCFLQIALSLNKNKIHEPPENRNYQNDAIVIVKHLPSFEVRISISYCEKVVV